MPHWPVGFPQKPPQPSPPHSRPLQSGRQPAHAARSGTMTSTTTMFSTDGGGKEWWHAGTITGSRTHAVVEAEVPKRALAVGVATVPATPIRATVLIGTVRRTPCTPNQSINQSHRHTQLKNEHSDAEKGSSQQQLSVQ